LWPPRAILDHVNSLRDEAFDSASYRIKGYLLRGSIKTDGHKVQLLAFKLRELQSVRHRRYRVAKLPPRLQSTVGGVDYYLSEIRNIVRSPEGIVRSFGCPGNKLKVLGLDLGQACVVGASLLLLEPEPGPNGVQNPEAFHNQAVKTKAVMQPIFKLRRWMDAQKHRPLDGSTEDTHDDASPAQPRTIKQIKSTLPSLKGAEASVSSHIKHREKHYEALNNFYNGNNYQFKKHTWDARRAKQEEYAKVANALLKAVGGSIGAKKADDNHVVIAVGLSKFQTKAGLASLDSTFSKYFIQMARSLGYISIGVNEFYTSQKCPRCENFIGRITVRRLHCRHCRRRYHRDAMAAANMCHIVRSYLNGNGRPRYLQPVRADGTYPWEEQTSVSSGNNGGSSPSDSGGGGGGNTNGGTMGAAPGNNGNNSNGRSTTGSGKRKATSKEGGRRKKAATAEPSSPMDRALTRTRVMEYNDDDAAGSSSSWVATAPTPAAIKRRTTSQSQSRATKKPAMRAEMTVMGSGLTSTNIQRTTSSTTTITNNGNSRRMVLKSTEPRAAAQRPARPATVQPNSNSDPSSADTAARPSENKEPLQRARKAHDDVFYASGSDAMDEDAPMSSNRAGSPVVQASVDPLPVVPEASVC
ncbi:hypothetical protein BGZ54_004335, partial [Gamsiella multidivaricata]